MAVLKRHLAFTQKTTTVIVSYANLVDLQALGCALFLKALTKINGVFVVQEGMHAPVVLRAEQIQSTKERT